MLALLAVAVSVAISREEPWVRLDGYSPQHAAAHFGTGSVLLSFGGQAHRFCNVVTTQGTLSVAAMRNVTGLTLVSVAGCAGKESSRDVVPASTCFVPFLRRALSECFNASVALRASPVACTCSASVNVVTLLLAAVCVACLVLTPLLTGAKPVTEGMTRWGVAGVTALVLCAPLARVWVCGGEEAWGASDKACIEATQINGLLFCIYAVVAASSVLYQFRFALISTVGTFCVWLASLVYFGHVLFSANSFTDDLWTASFFIQCLAATCGFFQLFVLLMRCFKMAEIQSLQSSESARNAKQ